MFIKKLICMVLGHRYYDKKKPYKFLYETIASKPGELHKYIKCHRCKKFVLLEDEWDVKQTRK